MALASSLASVHVYFELTSDDEDDEVVTEAAAWKIVGGLCAAWAALFAALLLLIPKRFIRAFVSFETSREYVCYQFTKEGASDEQKMKIHNRNPKKWASIRDDVRAWHHANWERWEEEEKPDWFTPALKARIDDEFIPVAALARLNNRAAGGQRRRSSVGGSIREAVAGTVSTRERRRRGSGAGGQGGGQVVPV